MRITKKSGRWSCAEIFLNRSLGYGTYSVTVRDTSQLEPAAVFSMFTFDEGSSEQHFREMDVEVAAEVLRIRIMHNMKFNRSTFLRTCSLLQRPQAP